MIQVNELRIGNWVWNGYSGYMVVTELKRESISLRHHQFEVDGKYSYSDISPIPLTPEILIACGFKDTRTRRVGFPDDIIEFNNGDYEINVDDGYNFVLATNDYGSMSAFVEVKYLHQLQNLYYSLTGQELIYKP